ncbi:putative holin-like toxin [Bacillus sp. AFS002410]|nr:putative holin-like toxin [Bacillus sp. AFS002410]
METLEILTLIFIAMTFVVVLIQLVVSIINATKKK